MLAVKMRLWLGAAVVGLVCVAVAGPAIGAAHKTVSFKQSLDGAQISSSGTSFVQVYKVHDNRSGDARARP